MLKLLGTWVFCTALVLGFAPAPFTTHAQVIPQAEQEMLDEPPTEDGLFDDTPEDDGMAEDDADPIEDRRKEDDATSE